MFYRTSENRRKNEKCYFYYTNSVGRYENHGNCRKIYERIIPLDKKSLFYELVPSYTDVTLKSAIIAGHWIE